MDTTTITFIIHSFVALLVIIDPFGNLPIFITLLGRFNESDRALMVKKAVFFATVTLIAITLSGNLVFELLDIRMYSFRIAGGILLLIVSIEMLFGRKSRTESSEDMEEEKEDITVTPLAIPLLTGPGAITTGIVLFSNAENDLNKIFLVITIVLVFLISYFILSKSNIIYRILGKTGTRVITRVMGLMLSAIAVQFIITGISEAVVDLSIPV
ncbi:MAG: MarC family protein [Candidatus Altiarchaeota archaeon]|nr:MarC family protein [Candidatus Altiarchaeota archaeon]